MNNSNKQTNKNKQTPKNPNKQTKMGSEFN